MQLKSYVQGRWHAGERDAQVLRDATTGQVIAEASSSGIDFAGVLAHARRKGGPALRNLTFHERASLLKRVAKLLTDRKDEFYALSYATGATGQDSDEEKSARALEVIYRSARAQNQLIGDLLDVSRIITGKSAPRGERGRI